ncbi:MULTISPECIES: RNA-guided endonuclease TnpB family protein [unclassified Acinetobacter]|jgi:putative transposase|nr:MULTISPECIES: RNA-guided endonuclease TnpB family protein [unclassified Acinetobacter]
MISGVKFRAYPTQEQKLILSQWMGCARLIWNAKCDEDKYFRKFASKFFPFKAYYSTQDQKYAQFRSKELTPWLAQCPGTILKNSTVNWYNTLKKSINGVCGRPKRKAKTDKGSIYLTRDLFSFEKDQFGKVRLQIGGKKFNIGYLKFKAHTDFKEPTSLYIRKERGQYFVSFCYKDSVIIDEIKLDEHLDHLQRFTQEQLNNVVVGIDRGVTIPVCTPDQEFDFSKEQKNHLSKAERYIKRLQRKLSKQQKGSNRRAKTKHRIAVHHAKKANIRNDFNHKTSYSLVNNEKNKVFIFEKLNTQKMTKKPKPKKDESGRFIPNKAKAKAGLNKAILNVGWYMLETYVKYKAKHLGKAVFKIRAAYTSQECASCGHTHPDNRKTQDKFKCVSCGHTDNADKNASKVIKSRAIKLIIYTGTVLEEDLLSSSSGRGGSRKTIKAKNPNRIVDETSKEMMTT